MTRTTSYQTSELIMILETLLKTLKHLNLSSSISGFHLPPLKLRQVNTTKTILYPTSDLTTILLSLKSTLLKQRRNKDMSGSQFKMITVYGCSQRPTTHIIIHSSKLMPMSYLIQLAPQLVAITLPRRERRLTQ